MKNYIISGSLINTPQAQKILSTVTEGKIFICYGADDKVDMSTLNTILGAAFRNIQIGTIQTSTIESFLVTIGMLTVAPCAINV